MAFALPPRLFRYRWATAPTFGYALAGFLATVTYRLGLSHSSLARALWLTSAISVVWFGWRARRDLRSRRLSGPVAGTLALFIAGGALMMAPYRVGGARFYAYQGSIQNQFTSIGASLAFSREHYRELADAAPAIFLRSPVATFGAHEIRHRPGAEHLFGILSEIGRDQSYRWGYLFLVFLSLNGALTATFLAANAFDCSCFRAALVAVPVFTGFWGQLPIDLNEWAFASSLPLGMLLTALVIGLSARAGAAMGGDEGLAGRRSLVVALGALASLVGFSIYFNPESTLWHLAILGMGALGLGFTLPPAERASFGIRARSPLMATGAALIFSSFYLSGTLGHLLGALKEVWHHPASQTLYLDDLEPFWGMGGWFRPLLAKAAQYSIAQPPAHRESQPWAFVYLFKQVFALGHLELIYYAVLDGFYGFLGMFWLVPLGGSPYDQQELWRVGLWSLPLAMIVWRKPAEPGQHLNRRYFTWFAGGVLALLLGCVVLMRLDLLAQAIFGAGPYLMLLAMGPLLRARRLLQFRNLPWGLVLLAQIWFAWVRIDQAKGRPPYFSIPYARTESVAFPNGRRDFDWDARRFDSELVDCREFYLDVPNGWQQDYVAFYLYAKGKPFTETQAIRPAYWSTQSFGTPRRTGREDCAFKSLNGKLELVKHFDFEAVEQAED